MKMSPQDYHVYIEQDDGKEIRAVSHFSGMTSAWPSTIHHCGKTYNFVTQEVMQDWMVGNFSGTARYQLT